MKRPSYRVHDQLPPSSNWAAIPLKAEGELKGGNGLRSNVKYKNSIGNFWIKACEQSKRLGSQSWKMAQ
eukprot:CAMPEP_0194053646 /NCGR_PEP_ID=MMETSP0009_2-20130614/50693_1 /TAXON_ID=210454 /ORGANISM="Grammatophora oceanica, Strain CCMP 410" /LENGTH=68 /DNA_ID=CAMNT_0038701845 /DNA_START=253 /DNA_END=459 /DNA_ORIENTATION=-